MLEKNNRLPPQEVRTILSRSHKRAVDEDNNDVGAFLNAEQAVSDTIVARSTAEGTLSAARIEREAA
jgi:hypothetical protein